MSRLSHRFLDMSELAKVWHSVFDRQLPFDKVIFVHYALTCCVFSFVEERFIFKKMIRDYVEVSSLEKHASRTLLIGEDSMKTYCKGTGTGTRRAFFFFFFFEHSFCIGCLHINTSSEVFNPIQTGCYFHLLSSAGTRGGTDSTSLVNSQNIKAMATKLGGQISTSKKVAFEVRNISWCESTVAPPPPFWIG